VRSTLIEKAPEPPSGEEALEFNSQRASISAPLGKYKLLYSARTQAAKGRSARNIIMLVKADLVGGK
jgi:hypothetical protein